MGKWCAKVRPSFWSTTPKRGRFTSGRSSTCRSSMENIIRRDVVTVERFFATNQAPLQLSLLAGAEGMKRVIKEPTVNRPGLALAGFTKYFASKRVQVIGNAESHFLKSLKASERLARYQMLFSHGIPCVVFCRG